MFPAAPAAERKAFAARENIVLVAAKPKAEPEPKPCRAAKSRRALKPRAMAPAVPVAAPAPEPQDSGARLLKLLRRWAAASAERAAQRAAGGRLR